MGLQESSSTDHSTPTGEMEALEAESVERTGTYNTAVWKRTCESTGQTI